jgi:hypothetical protein
VQDVPKYIRAAADRITHGDESAIFELTCQERELVLCLLSIWLIDALDCEVQKPSRSEPEALSRLFWDDQCHALVSDALEVMEGRRRCHRRPHFQGCQATERDCLSHCHRND